MTDTDPVLRHTCQWCKNQKHAVQYTALVTFHPSEQTIVHAEKPGVCLVCPRCDSPGAAR